MSLTIKIAGLRLATRLGVPDVERSQWQTVEVDLRMTPLVATDFADDLARTVDYGAVARRMRDLAAAHPRRLLETLAEDLAADLLASFALREIELTVKKYIVPGAAFVAVELRKANR